MEPNLSDSPASPTASATAAPASAPASKPKPKRKAAKARAPKKAAAHKGARKAPKPARKPRAAAHKPNGHIGRHGKTLHDGRRKPGTNPPMSEKARRYGKKVAAARAKKGWTQAVLAKKIGITQPGLANIERGVGGGGREETRRKLAKALGL